MKRYNLNKWVKNHNLFIVCFGGAIFFQIFQYLRPICNKMAYIHDIFSYIANGSRIPKNVKKQNCATKTDKEKIVDFDPN